MGYSEYSSDSEKGFTLIECTIALLITMVGVLACAGLIVVAIRLQVDARDATTANSLARAKLEQLQNANPASAERARGNGVTAVLAGYNDVPDIRYRRRWRIETFPLDAGVPINTQRVTVVMEPNVQGVRLPNITLTTLMPAS